MSIHMMIADIEKERDSLVEDCANRVKEIGELKKQRGKLLNGLGIALDTMADGNKYYDEQKSKVYEIWKNGLEELSDE